MIFLSAQPDDFYFTWQIELFIHNFLSLGVQPSSIHILIGYNEKKGINPFFEKFIIENEKKATFFCYPDRRSKGNYISTIRPHIISQHITKFPKLSREVFFYHDSDILFRELPNFNKLKLTDTWFVSDTRQYIGAEYIIEVSSLKFLEEMGAVVGLSTDIILRNDKHAGGAQYLLKETDASFWYKVEKDSETLFNLMNKYNSENQGKRQIQSWCADMWALLWNGWYQGNEIKISEELDFCWTINPIKKFKTKKILHYAGKVDIDELHYFRKLNYKYHPPYYDFKLAAVNDAYCGKFIRENIYALLSSKKKYNLLDTTFLILIDRDIVPYFENLLNTIVYLNTNFDTRILIIDDGYSDIDKSYFPENVRLKVFAQNEVNNNNFEKTILRYIQTELVCVYSHSLLIHPRAINKAIKQVRKDNAIKVCPHSEDGYFIDPLLKSHFYEFQDFKILENNIGKCLAQKEKKAMHALVSSWTNFYSNGVFKSKTKIKRLKEHFFQIKSES